MKDMLIITEKPSVAKAYAEALAITIKKNKVYTDEKRNIEIVNCVGHLVEALEPKEYDTKYEKWTKENLPIIPPEIKYKVSKEKKETYKVVEERIKSATREGKEIVVATDAGQEGEVIARLVLKKANAENYEKTTRIWESQALTKEVVEKAIEERKKISEYNQIWEKGIAWKEADWIMGINGTRAISIIKKELYPLGRVQTPVLKEIEKRKKERETFQKEKYIEVKIKDEDEIEYKVLPEGGDKYIEPEGIYLSTIKKELEKEKTIKIVKVEEKEKEEKPPHLYDITAIQQEAYKAYKIKPKEVTEILQYLYEVEKVISYPRTPSRVMGENDEKLIKEKFRYFVSKNGVYARITTEKNLTTENKRLFNNKELEDHHAIIPLAEKKEDDTKQYKIYKMILERFIMQFTENYKTREKEINGKVGKITVKAKIKEIEELGWKKLEKVTEQEDIRTKKINISEGQDRNIKKVTIETSYTKEPEAYNYATILGYMKNPKNKEESVKLIGIGTPATRQEILNKIGKYKYITDEKGKIEITEKGENLLEVIRKIKELDQITDIDTTTKWEHIAETNTKQIRDQTEKSIITIISQAKELMMEKEVIAQCPVCEGSLYEGKNGYYCENYNGEKTGQKCFFQILGKIKGNEVTKEEVQEIIEKGETQWKQGVNKNGDKCTYKIVLEEKEIKIKYDNVEEIVLQCPKCNSGMVDRPKRLYCTNQKCSMSIWKNKDEVNFNLEEIKRMIKGEESEIKTAKTKTGIEYKTKYRMNINFEIERISNEVFAQCPKCQSNMINYPLSVKCSNKECNVNLWKMRSGASYTNEELKILCEGKEINNKRYTGKDGKEYTGDFQLDIITGLVENKRNKGDEK